MTDSDLDILQKQRDLGLDKNLACFCVLNYFLSAGVSVIIPFYPPLAVEAGLSMSEVGYVMAINPLGGVVFSLILGAKMAKWGRKKCMLIALVHCINIQ